MFSASQAVWLFTRGQQSVRIIRAAAPDGRQHLTVHGPEAASESRVFRDSLEAVRTQSDLEAKLVSTGFTLEQFSTERRSGRDRRGASRGKERRR